MKAQIVFFHCGDQLRRTLAAEIREVGEAIASVEWAEHFRFSLSGTLYERQRACNKALAAQFTRMGWEPEPVLRSEPKLIGDFRKGLVFIEIQFGNSSTLYRDYYKFQYGLANGLLSLAVLLVPTTPSAFFPTRSVSMNNRAEYELAHRCLSVLPINVPTMLVGLQAEN